MMTWAYIAGFLDADGTVEARNRRVSIFQKERAVLDAIKSFLDSQGVICTIGSRADRIHNNLGYLMRQHCLRVVDKPSVEKFLLNVRPYAIVKKQLVEDVWRYLRFFPRLSHKVTGGLSRITHRHISVVRKGQRQAIQLT